MKAILIVSAIVAAVHGLNLKEHFGPEYPLGITWWNHLKSELHRQHHKTPEHDEDKSEPEYYRLPILQEVTTWNPTKDMNKSKKSLKRSRTTKKGTTSTMAKRGPSWYKRAA
ncbi:hypothetical protein OSTOST_09932 [Ostertagia ostertagi]